MAAHRALLSQKLSGGQVELPRRPTTCSSPDASPEQVSRGVEGEPCASLERPRSEHFRLCDGRRGAWVLLGGGNPQLVGGVQMLCLSQRAGDTAVATNTLDLWAVRFLLYVSYT